jgi:hypothetical protein
MHFGLHKALQKLQFALAQIEFPDAGLFTHAMLQAGLESGGFCFVQNERCRIDAVTKARRLRAIFKHMPQMRIATAA